MESQRPVMPLEIMKYVSPAMALERAQSAVHDAWVLLSVYHSPGLQEVAILSEAEETIKNLAILWTSLANNVLTRADRAMESQGATVPPDAEETS